MRIIISNQSGTPIYEQISDQLTELIMTGELREGDALPSIRQLARELRISVITTARAYSELEQKGLVSAMQGKGYYVMPRNTGMIREQYLRKIEEHLLAAIEDARIAGIGGSELAEMLNLLTKEDKGSV